MPRKRVKKEIQRVILMADGQTEQVSYPENDHLYADMPLEARVELFPDELRDAKTGEVLLERKWTYKEIGKMPMNRRVEMFGNTDIDLLARDVSLLSVRNWSFCIPYLRKQRRERQKVQQSSLAEATNSR